MLSVLGVPPRREGEGEAGDEEEEEDDRHDDDQQRVESHRGRTLGPVRALQLQHHGLVTAGAGLNNRAYNKPSQKLKFVGECPYKIRTPRQRWAWVNAHLA